MTYRQMEKEFEQTASFIDAVKKRNLRVVTDDKQFFLNEAQNSFIHTRINNVRKKIGNRQRELDEIRTLIVKSKSLVATTLTSLYNEYDLPSDYHYLIADRTATTYCSITREYQNRLMESENITEALHGTHTKPKYNSPISELYGNTLRVYRDYNLTFTINDVNIDYVRDWAEIDLFNGVDCELDDSVHKDIVQLAVNIFLEAVESGRFKTNIEKNTITEQI